MVVFDIYGYMDISIWTGLGEEAVGSKMVARQSVLLGERKS